MSEHGRHVSTPPGQTGAMTFAAARRLLAALLLLRSPATQAAPAREHGALEGPSARFAEAQARLDAGDHDGAIALLTAGLEQVPEGPGYAPTRTRLLLLIVEANSAGFRVDGELERLRRSRLLLDRYLGPLDLLDEQGRGEAEERRSGLIAQVAEIEAARRRADGERAAAERRERAATARSQVRTWRIAGITTYSLGVAGVSVMAAGFGVGNTADERLAALGSEYGETSCDLESAECEERYQALQGVRRRGNAGNIMVVVGATAGGALLATGLTLLLVARKKNRESRALQVAPAPMIGRTGLGLGLVGRF